MEITNSPTQLKIVVVGDDSVGKTSLLMSYVNETFPQEHIPTIYDNYVAKRVIDGMPVQLNLWDTAGQEDSQYQVRPMSYPETDVFLVCFSVTSCLSLENVEKKWVPEIRQYCPETPIILVATKLDQNRKTGSANTSNSTPYHKSLAVAKRIGAINYVECSAKQNHNIAYLFDKTIKASMLSPKFS